jgi:bifunctional DNA-binding transcriptional regulator/antitoxin component of YhaV-PrlF toxin-antitoxin module
MSKTGRLTLPAEIRRAMDLEGEAEFEVEASEGELVLRPLVLLRREDAWAYTPEVIESIQRGLNDIRNGRERHAREIDFRNLAEVSDE